MTHAVVVGPIRGEVRLKDGTVIDVRPDVVYVDTVEQATELAAKVGDRYAAEGHPAHDPGKKFIHDRKKG